MSRKLGDRHDSIQRDVLDGQVVVSDRLRLTRDAWAQVQRPAVQVVGLDACRPFFDGP